MKTLVINVKNTALFGLISDIVVVDFGQSKISEGTSYFGIRSMDSYGFSGFEKVFINTAAAARLLNRRTGSDTMHYKEFKAFIKTLEGDKICIGVDFNKERLIRKMINLRPALKAPVYDNTEAVPVILSQ